MIQICKVSVIALNWLCRPCKWRWMKPLMIKKNHLMRLNKISLYRQKPSSLMKNLNRKKGKLMKSIKFSKFNKGQNKISATIIIKKIWLKELDKRKIIAIGLLVDYAIALQNQWNNGVWTESQLKFMMKEQFRRTIFKFLKAPNDLNLNYCI